VRAFGSHMCKWIQTAAKQIADCQADTVCKP